MRSTWKLLAAALLLAVLFGTPVFATGGGETDQQMEEVGPLSPDDPYTFTFLWPFTGGPKWGPGDNTPIAQEMFERTGIRIEMQETTGDWAEFHNLLVASGDFPDMLTMGQGREVNRYLDAQALVSLEELVPEYAPTFYEMLTSPDNGNVWNTYRNMGRGEVYFYGMASEWVFKGQPKVQDLLNDDPLYLPTYPDSATAMFLYPTLAEFTDEKPETLDDVWDLLVAYQEEYGGDGVHYAMTTYDQEGDVHVETPLYFDNFYIEDSGLRMVWTDEDPTYRIGFLEDTVRDYLLWLNRAYREGLMDPEGPIQTEDQAQTKYNNAHIFAKVGSWNLVHTANSAFPDIPDLSDMTYIPMKVTIDEDSEYRGWNVGSIGWRMTGITVDAERPAKIAQWIEWAYSEPGAWLLLNWGFEGEDYIFNDKGEPDLTDEIVATHTGDYYYDLGLSIGDTYPWVWPVLPQVSRTIEGYPPINMLADYYTAGDPAMDDRDRAVIDSVFNWHTDYTGENWQDFTIAGTAGFVPDQVALNWQTAGQQLDDIVNQIILAESEADALARYEQGVEQVLALGVQDYVDWYNENYPQE